MSGLISLLNPLRLFRRGDPQPAPPVYPLAISVAQPVKPAQTGPDLKAWARQTVEKVRTWVSSGHLQFLPWLDNYTEETPEIRAHYREMLREPTLKAALSTKVLSVASDDIQVQPEDEGDALQVYAAKCVGYALGKLKGARKVVGPGGVDTPLGWGGPRKIAWNVLSGAVIDGWSLNEVTLQQRPEPSGLCQGKILWDTFKAKDTRYSLLMVDGYKNVVGVKGIGFNAGKTWEGPDLDSFVIYPHFALFESPTGISDFRAAYRAFWIKDAAWKLRYLFLKRNTTPTLMGEHPDQDVKLALDAAFEEFQINNWINVPAGSMVRALELAGSGTADFDRAIHDCDREMLVGTVGSYLQILEGQVSDGRGDTNVHKETSELFSWMLSATLGDTVTQQLVAPWVRLNWGDLPCPSVTWGTVSEQALSARARVDAALQALGMELSAREAYKYYARARPLDPSDVLRPVGAPEKPAQNGPGPLLKPPAPSP